MYIPWTSEIRNWDCRRREKRVTNGVKIEICRKPGTWKPSGTQMFGDQFGSSLSLCEHLLKWLKHIWQYCVAKWFIWFQERIKGLKEIIPHIGPLPIVIPLKLSLDLLWGLLFPRGLSDSQSYVLNFTNVDMWAKAHAMLRDVRESTVMLEEDESHIYFLWTNATAGKWV